MSTNLWLSVLLIIIKTITCAPNLCTTEGTEPLEAFTSITKLVNESYLISNHLKYYSVDEESKTPNFSLNIKDLISNNNQNLNSKGINNFYTTFVLDFNQYCVNIEEVFYGFDGKVFTSFSRDGWSEPIFLKSSEDAFIKLIEPFVRDRNAIVLYFQSFGIVVITGKTNSLVNCNPTKGWKVSKDVIVMNENSIQVDWSYIDTGVVDNEEGIVYLFILKKKGQLDQHIRQEFYQCLYELNVPKISLNCKKESMNTLCPQKSFFIEYIAIGGMGVLLAIVIIVIICIFCTKMKKKASEPKTLNTDRVSAPVSPNDHSNTSESTPGLGLNRKRVLS